MTEAEALAAEADRVFGPSPLNIQLLVSLTDARAERDAARAEAARLLAILQKKRIDPVTGEYPVADFYDELRLPSIEEDDE